MNEFWKGWAAGLIPCLVISTYLRWDDPRKEQLQLSYSNIEEMKKECEKSFPRDKVCKAEIKFVIEEGE